MSIEVAGKPEDDKAGFRPILEQLNEEKLSQGPTRHDRKGIILTVLLKRTHSAFYSQ